MDVRPASVPFAASSTQTFQVQRRIELTADEKAQGLHEAAKGFESFFLTSILKAARAGSFGDELTGGNGVNQAQDMFDAEIARSSAERSGLGIAEAIERQFTPMISRRG